MISTKPKVSVNIPVYNGEKTIAAAVQSILSQSFNDFELIVVNDCSSDATPQILNEFRDPRLRVLHHEQNQGISRTRNDALKASGGGFIAVLDADDVALPQRLDKQIAVLARDRALAGVFSGSDVFTDKPDMVTSFWRPRGVAASEMREAILFESPFAHSSAFLRREAMGNGYREDLSCAEDYAKWLDLILSGALLEVIPEPLIRSWSHTPTNYTNEKMQTNMRMLQGECFEKILGRPMTDVEWEAQWSLYELAWTPTSREDARARLRSANDWISTLSVVPLRDPAVDQARLLRAACAKMYPLCRQANKVLGVEVLKFSRRLTRREQVKLAWKVFLG